MPPERRDATNAAEWLRVAFPKTHAISDLLTILESSGVGVPAEVRQAGALTGYAVEARYPGLSEEVTEGEYVEALALAERVVRWAESWIAGQPE